MEIRPWRCGDETLALAAQPYLSMRSLNQRFLAGTGGRLPGSYLRHVADGPRPTWDAQVAVGPGHLLGWAEFGRLSPDSAEGDLAIIVADPWHRQGIASTLILAMLPRAAATGIRTLHADMLPGNTAAHHPTVGAAPRAAGLAPTQRRWIYAGAIGEGSRAINVTPGLSA